MPWCKKKGSNLPTRAALAETRQHIGHFSSRSHVDRRRQRTIHLEISALTFGARKDRCLALLDDLCSIYASRPLSCRTVPLHYSRPLSVIGEYLDSFTSTAAYSCDTSDDAPVLLKGASIADPLAKEARSEAFKLADTDRDWKHSLVERMVRADTALAAGFPTYEVVAANSDRGSATMVSMLVAWRVARDIGLLSTSDFRKVCHSQFSLLTAALDAASDPHVHSDLREMLSDYEIERGLDQGREAQPGPPIANGVEGQWPQPPEAP
ncbi:MAG: YkgJ family cysteine cluster protein [Sandarakinorhabdus sp.]|nr:YkgJ family cysteine cluster protein [Sandarakinorhabdus sp.]